MVSGIELEAVSPYLALSERVGAVDLDFNSYKLFPDAAQPLVLLGSRGNWTRTLTHSCRKPHNLVLK